MRRYVRYPIYSFTLFSLAFGPAMCGQNVAFSAESAAGKSAVNTADNPTDKNNPDILVVTADRQAKPLSRTTATTTVITTEQVRERGYQPFVHDWLRGLPGVDVVVSGGFANSTSIRLRGADTAETRYMRDGIPITDSTGIGGDPQIGFIDQSGITQVEIVRGAQSGMWGSASSGGVINLIGLRATDKHHGAAQLDYGSFNTLAGSAQATGPLYAPAGLGYAASIGGISSDGFSVSTNPGDKGDAKNYEKDAYERVSGNLRLEGNYAHGSLFIAGSYLDGSSDYDATWPTSQPNDPLPTQNQETQQISAGGDVKFAERAQLQLRAAHTQSLRQYPNETTYTRDYEGTDNFASAVLNSKLSHGFSTVLGADGLRQQAENIDTVGNVTFDEKAHIYGVFAQLAYDHAWFTSSLSGRHDEHSREGGANTFRYGAAAFLFDKRYKLVGNVGSGFLAPSLYQLYDTWSGNADLKAQTSLSADFGHVITLTESGWSLSNIFFTTHYDEKIDYDFVSSRFQNLSSNGQINGLENDLRWSDDHYASGITYTYQNSDDGKNKPLVRTPEHKMMWDGSVRNYGGWLRVAVERVWSRLDSGDIALDPYTVLSASAGYELNQHWEIYTRAENIANERYEIISAYATPRQSIYGGVRGRF
jgi:vitamin B12 transporter